MLYTQQDANNIDNVETFGAERCVSNSINLAFREKYKNIEILSIYVLKFYSI
jgi:hypothetical protein